MNIRTTPGRSWRDSRPSFLLVVLLFACAARFVSAETLLRWKMEPGKKLRYAFQQESVTESSGAGKQTSVSLTMSMELTWTVDAVDPQHVATITQSIDKLSIKMKVDNMDPLTYDSSAKTPSSGPVKDVADAVSPLIGAACVMRITDRGEIQAVEPGAELRKALEKVKAGELFTGDGVSRVLRQAVTILPEAGVAAGATWEKNRTLATPIGEIKQIDRYTYAGPAEHEGKTLEKIAIETVLSPESSKEVKPRPVALKEINQNGTLWFDAMAGHCVSSDVEQRIVTRQTYREFTITVQTTSKLGVRLL